MEGGGSESGGGDDDEETSVVDRAVEPGHKRRAVAPGARTGRSVACRAAGLGWVGSSLLVHPTGISSTLGPGRSKRLTQEGKEREERE